MGLGRLVPCALTAALCGLVVVAAAGAQPGPAARAAHIIVVPTEGAAARTLRDTDARVIARYPAFDLVEAAGNDAARLQRAGASLRDDMREMKLGRAELDPKRERGRLDHAGGSPGLAVVQFVGPIKDAWLARLRATGVRVVTYMAENGYLVRGSAPELAALERLAATDDAVRAVVAYAPADKLGPGVRESGRQRFAVQTLSGDDGAAARRRVEASGRSVRSDSAVGSFRTEYVELDATEARSLAADPGVVSIQPSPEPELFDERADQIVAGATGGGDPLLPTGPGYLSFYNGLGLTTSTFSSFVVDVTDEGIDVGSTATNHPDFHEGGSLASPSRIAYADDYTRDVDARDCGGHGTINASIIGGFNNATGPSVEDSGGFNYGLGVAPRVRLGASKIFRCGTGSFDLSGSTLTSLAATAYGRGARVANHSWGADTGGAYTADSQEFDRIVRDAQPAVAGNQSMVELVAAGNAGSGANTVGSPATAKNVIAVGASESPRASGTDGCGVTDAGSDDARDMASFSSRGPTDDARVKPELVAPGTHITGAQSHAVGYDGTGVCNESFPAGSTLYNLSSGTSHSTPVVTGMAALFREWFLERRGVAPSPALTRAALANSALDQNGGSGVAGNVPNSNQGWGLANLPNLLDGGPRYFRDQTTTFGASGASFQRALSVADGSKPVRVTLAWTDPPGPTTGNSFVNNLDLTVTTSAGTFRGNAFSGGVSVTGGVSDTRNNLESVYLPSGTSGPITVTVTATNVAGDGVPGNGDSTDQDFALVVSNSALAAPAQPVGLVATPGTRSISLDWSDVAGATGYQVFRRPAGASYPSSPTATPASSAFNDTGLTPAAEYCYVVRALNDEVAGPLSAEQCATVPGAAAPSVTATDPPSPANDNTPRIIGTAVAGSTVRLYTTSGCTGTAVATGTASQFASGGIEAQVADNSSTTFRATAEGGDGQESACSAGSVTYVEDSSPPGPPSVTSTQPASPANDNTPRIKGAASGAATVRLYASSNCAGAPAATGTAADFGSPGIQVAVADDSSTAFRATALDAAGNQSACSPTAVTYEEDSTAPSSPSFTGTAPASPADENSPRILGTAEPDSTVRLYTNTFCGGAVAATGSAAGFASPGLQVAVSDNSTTTFYATAADAAGNTSGCSLGAITYVEQSASGGSEPPPGGTPGDTGGTTGGDTGGTTGGGTGDAVAATINLSLLPRSKRASAQGVFTLAFVAAPVGTAGTIRLTTVKAFAAAKRRLVVARKAFTAAAGRTRVKLRLTRRGFRLLKRVRRLSVSAKVTFGGTSAQRRIVLRAPRPR